MKNQIRVSKEFIETFQCYCEICGFNTEETEEQRRVVRANFDIIAPWIEKQVKVHKWYVEKFGENITIDMLRDFLESTNFDMEDVEHFTKTGLLRAAEICYDIDDCMRWGVRYVRK